MEDFLSFDGWCEKKPILQKSEAADTARLYNKVVDLSPRYRRDERDFIVVLKNGIVVHINEIPREPGGIFVTDDAGKPRFQHDPEIAGGHRFRNGNVDPIASGEDLDLREKF